MLDGLIDCKRKTYGSESCCTRRERKQLRPAREADRASVSVPLGRLFQVGGEHDNFSALFYGNPLHSRFEPRRNVKLNHLCHNRPPIHRSPLASCIITSPGFLLNCLIRCGRRLEVPGRCLKGTRNFHAATVFHAAAKSAVPITDHVGMSSSVQRSAAALFFSPPARTASSFVRLDR
jgi:hypothetical protein